MWAWPGGGGTWAGGVGATGNTVDGLSQVGLDDLLLAKVSIFNCRFLVQSMLGRLCLGCETTGLGKSSVRSTVEGRNSSLDLLPLLLLSLLLSGNMFSDFLFFSLVVGFPTSLPPSSLFLFLTVFTSSSSHSSGSKSVKADTVFFGLRGCTVFTVSLELLLMACIAFLYWLTPLWSLAFLYWSTPLRSLYFFPLLCKD